MERGLPEEEQRLERQPEDVRPWRGHQICWWPEPPGPERFCGRLVTCKRREVDPLADNPVFKLFRNKFYLDEIYLRIVRFTQDKVAAFLHFLDEFLIGDLLVGGLARSATGLGNAFRRLQNGNLQAYAILFGAGIILVIYLTVFSR